MLSFGWASSPSSELLYLEIEVYLSPALADELRTASIDFDERRINVFQEILLATAFTKSS